MVIGKKNWCVGEGGVTVSMDAFQAFDPGSTPGPRIANFAILTDIIVLASASTYRIPGLFVTYK